MVCCVFCNHETEELFFCDQCGKILPVGTQNYFELFGIEDPANADIDVLNSRLFKLQSMVHPDNFIGETIDEISISIAHSSKINKAYEILKSPAKRLEYSLRLMQLTLDNNALPNEFALAAFELQERAENMKSEDEKDAFYSELKAQAEILIYDAFRLVRSNQGEEALRKFAIIKYLHSVMFNLAQ